MDCNRKPVSLNKVSVEFGANEMAKLIVQGIREAKLPLMDTLKNMD
ncbi:hypothetical protein M6D81_08975 [Paenibacillus sp. J5C_2022]|nr:hypothetical protein [Paenibacillus sp. J5C2022]MCU6708852.1 hypothetical protein [Paenibacillus sp. J5C2022]